MSDFFADIYRGIQNPAVVMNNGPLPPESMKGQSYPPGFDGTPDGRINQASTLLGDSSVQPYALGHADRLSTQTAYLNIPHAAYRVVPPINLPDTIGKMDEGAGTFQLTHQVDDGDVAFVIRAMYTPHNIVENKGRYARQGILHAVDPVCNLATVNYILHGIQRYGFDPKNVHWNTLWVALGLETQFEGYKAKNNGRSLSALMKEATEAIENNGYLTLSYYAIIRECRKIIAEHLIKNVIRPFGVAKGSEKQGGQHQGLVNRSVTWPVDYVTTLVIDGKTINLVNYWRQDEISGGDDLLFYLQEHNATEYVLSHHPKSYRKVKYPSLKKYPIPDVLVDKKSDNTSQREIAQRFFDTMGEVLLLFDLIFNDGIGRVVGDDDRVDPEDDRADDESFLVARVAGRVDKKGQGVVGEPFHAYSITVTDEDAKMFELEFAQRFILEVNNVLTEKNMTPWINFMEQLKNRLSSGMGEDISDIGEGVLDTCFYVYDTLAKMLPTKDESKPLGSDAGSGEGSNMQGEPPGRLSARSLQEPLDSRVSFQDESIWQLVPGVSSSRKPGVVQAVWKMGYWHIARSQIMQFAYDGNVDISSGCHAALGGKPLEATFTPTWVEPLEQGILVSRVTCASTFPSGIDDPKTGMKRRREDETFPYPIRVNFDAMEKLLTYGQLIDETRRTGDLPTAAKVSQLLDRNKAAVGKKTTSTMSTSMPGKPLTHEFTPYKSFTRNLFGPDLTTFFNYLREKPDNKGWKGIENMLGMITYVAQLKLVNDAIKNIEMVWELCQGDKKKVTSVLENCKKLYIKVSEENLGTSELDNNIKRLMEVIDKVEAEIHASGLHRSSLGGKNGSEPDGEDGDKNGSEPDGEDGFKKDVPADEDGGKKEDSSDTDLFAKYEDKASGMTQIFKNISDSANTASKKTAEGDGVFGGIEFGSEILSQDVGADTASSQKAARDAIFDDPNTLAAPAPTKKKTKKSVPSV